MIAHHILIPTFVSTPFIIFYKCIRTSYASVSTYIILVIFVCCPNFYATAIISTFKIYIINMKKEIEVILLSSSNQKVSTNILE